MKLPDAGFQMKKYKRDWLRKEDEINHWLPLRRTPIYLKGKLLILRVGFEGETCQSLVLRVRNTETKTQHGGKDQELAFESDGSACVSVVKIHQYLAVLQWQS